jgi:hypothetical protein
MPSYHAIMDKLWKVSPLKTTYICDDLYAFLKDHTPDQESWCWCGFIYLGHEISVV